MRVQMSGVYCETGMTVTQQVSGLRGGYSRLGFADNVCTGKVVHGSVPSTTRQKVLSSVMIY